MQAQINQNNDEPQRFYPVSKKAEALNLGEVKAAIKMPRGLTSQEKQDTILFRILVDANGNYTKHLPPKSGNPQLITEIEKHLSELRFSPSMSGDESVKVWVNVPFSFAKKKEKIYK